MGATLSGQLGDFDWANTRAFVGFHGDLWINKTGREQSGVVDEHSAGELLDEIAHGLLELEDERTGERVFHEVLRKDEIYSGPAVDLAPDLMLDSWSVGYRVAPRRDPAGPLVQAPAPLAGVRESWSSDHRPLGVVVAAGPRISAGSAPELSLYDVAPTCLALLDQEVPRDLDGRVAEELIDTAWLGAHPVRWAGDSADRSPSGEYSDAEAAAVAEHLRDLGYIE
jgi:predicted AlkP superfamily phosphohydrolase/phosphomutase